MKGPSINLINSQDWYRCFKRWNFHFLCHLFPPVNLLCECSAFLQLHIRKGQLNTLHFIENLYIYINKPVIIRFTLCVICTIIPHIHITKKRKKRGHNFNLKFWQEPKFSITRSGTILYKPSYPVFHSWTMFFCTRSAARKCRHWESSDDFGDLFFFHLLLARCCTLLLVKE